MLKRADSGIGEEYLLAFLALTKDCKIRLRTEAQAIGRRIYAEKPGDFLRRIHISWETWKREV